MIFFSDFIDACKTVYPAREELLVSLGINTGWIISTGNAKGMYPGLDWSSISMDTYDG
jgi:hypothetical protein